MDLPTDIDVLVTGASGFIGARVAAYLSLMWITGGTWFTNQAISVADCDMFQLDVRKYDHVLNLIAKRLKPRVIVHIAGTKDIKFCQAHQAEAWRLHVEGTKNVVNACKEIDARIVYISTDCVFNGHKAKYTESDATEPFNTYGATKYAGERIVLNSGLKSLIIRASLLFGWSLRGQASNYVLQVLESLRDRKNVEAATNLYNTPALIDHAAEIIARLAMDYSSEGTVHLAGKDRISRYEFARLIARVFGFEESRVIPVFDRTGLRQPNSCLDCQKLERLMGERMPGVEESLDHMVTMRSVSSRVRWEPQ
jgi:dTDP-4-dehydrorhamnose reductase